MKKSQDHKSNKSNTKTNLNQLTVHQKKNLKKNTKTAKKRPNLKTAK